MSQPKLKQASDISVLIESALRTIDAEASGIAALSTAIRSDLGKAFANTVELIKNARGRLIVTGMGKSGHIARKIAATFASTGIPAFYVHPGEASHGDLGMITPDDVILALSWSGETSEMKDLVDYSRRFRIPFVTITAEPESTLGRASDIILALPEVREACPHNLAPTTSTLTQLVIGDALAIALLESRGFTALDFHVFHPGGRLGAMLKVLRDVMHTGTELPLKPLGTHTSDAIMEMSAKRLGCVGITNSEGDLVGIITDGDLRRHMRPDLLEARVDEIMTRNPTTSPPDQLVSEALEILNSSTITALFIVEGKKPIGIVHLHDLLRAGVA